MIPYHSQLLKKKSSHKSTHCTHLRYHMMPHTHNPLIRHDQIQGRKLENGCEDPTSRGKFWWVKPLTSHYWHENYPENLFLRKRKRNAVRPRNSLPTELLRWLHLHYYRMMMMPHTYNPLIDQTRADWRKWKLRINVEKLSYRLSTCGWQRSESHPASAYTRW